MDRFINTILYRDWQSVTYCVCRHLTLRTRLRLLPRLPPWRGCRDLLLPRPPPWRTMSVCWRGMSGQLFQWWGCTILTALRRIFQDDVYMLCLHSGAKHLIAIHCKGQLEPVSSPLRCAVYSINKHIGSCKQLPSCGAETPLSCDLNTFNGITNMNVQHSIQWLNLNVWHLFQ